MTHISFPGLGIEPFRVNPKITIPGIGLDIAWYGIIITCGMILAVLYALHMGQKKEHLKSDDILDLAIFVVFFGVLGARLYYVVFDWGSYLVTTGGFFSNLWKTFLNIINIRAGGLAIYGGIIGGLLTAFFVARHKKIPFLVFFDLLAPCVLIGQIIGRFGNFVNMEVYGSETESFLRMGLHRIVEGEIVAETFVQPLFLYESIWNLMGLVLIHILFTKKKFHGELFCTYLIWYGFGRMILEGMRNPKYNLMIGSLPVSQLVGGFSLVLGIALMIVFAAKAKRTAENIEAQAMADESTLALNQTEPNNTEE